MKKKEYRVDVDDNKTRVDKYLARNIQDLSRSYIQDLIDEGKVMVNNRVVKKSYQLQTGDQILVKIPPPRAYDLEPLTMNLDILYEDKDILVINKQPNLTVHPVPGNRTHTLVNALLAYTDDLSGIHGMKRPGIVHRLDKNTSGALVVAKNDKSHRNLVNQFKDRKIKKNYRTLLTGRLKYRSGKIDAPIGRDPANRTKMKVIKENSKEAVTIFKVLEEFSDCTYVEVSLKTGRTHQIRVHFSYIGHPVIGDTRYGPCENKYGAKRQLLHAYLLGFYHPVMGEWMEVKAPLAEDFCGVLKNLS